MNDLHESYGKILHNKIKTMEGSKICMIDKNTGEEITYGQLLKYSVILANELKKLGVKKGTVITIIHHNSWKYMLTLIASFYIGAHINLLNPNYTLNELEHLLLICKPILLFCSQEVLINILKLTDKILYQKKIILFEGDNSNFILCDHLLKNKEYDLNFSPVETNSEDVAVMLTSSGTTGLPKCVLLTYVNISKQTLVQSDPNIFDINEKTKVIAYLPSFHIYGVVVYLSTIVHGGQLIILKKFEPDIFLKTIEYYKIRKLFTVPTVLHFLAKDPLVEKYDLSSVTDILCGGASSSKEVEKLIKDKFGQPPRQFYGMTEVCLASIIPKNVVKMGSVGKPIPTYQIKICDIKSGEELPVNHIGELLIKGSGVMKGYLDNKEATDAIFDKNNFLKSGDLGYYDKDGFLYVVDRTKEMIKYKSFQVAPAELENLIIQHPAVSEVGVVGKPDERFGELAVAFIVKKPGENVTEEEIIQFVESKSKHFNSKTYSWRSKIFGKNAKKFVRKNFEKKIERIVITSDFSTVLMFSILYDL